MTGPDTTTLTPPMRTIDGKYEVVRELSRSGNVTLYEVNAAAGALRRVAWFTVGSQADRQGFHTYRTALRAISPAGLTDVVARPGAYYAVWQPVTGTPLTDVVTQPQKQEETVEAVQALAAALANHGFALADADVVLDGQAPRVAYLRPAPQGRSPEDIAALNAPTLAALAGGRVRRKKRERAPGAWLSFVPGLLFLGGAGWLGAQAAQIYLNPPVKAVAAVTGKDARTAAQTLTQSGFRVEYAYGDNANAAVGAVLRQEPAGGTTLPIGRQIVLTVNKPPLMSVPRVEDQTVDQARSLLRDGGLRLGKVVRVDGTLSATPEGRIVAQVPAQGSSTERGQPVQVMVSTGVQGKETWIADLSGMTFEQARDHTRAAGLVINSVSREPSDGPQNLVLRQDPSPFVRVTVGSPVRLVISSARYTPPNTPAGSLPLPPAYVPPLPSVPDEGQGTDTDSGAATPDTATPSTSTPDTSSTTPQEIPPLPQTGLGDNSAQSQTPDPLAARQVDFQYDFPADLPEGSYSVVVQDADGERQVLPATEAARLAGQRAQTPVEVRGNAVFIVRQGTAEYARVAAQ
ncbi:PASTA domain-containing protein [Deinococcus sp. Leaf326]|uniref:PASTA domain-containing protein n=1 Tax=Deinococcus sp. Leaf326 TaxID=1736338 RepID=UPI000ACCA9DF|nr:PASTA domain-containing protein [Deinococcus sp. Leaf326]